MSYKHRIILLFISACSLVVGIFSLFVYILVDNHTQSQFEARLEERAILAAQVLLEKDELSTSRYNEIVKQQLKKLMDEVHYIIPIDEQRKPVLSQFPDELWIKEVFEKKFDHLEMVFAEKNDAKIGYLYYEDNEGDYYVAITATDVDGQEDLEFIRQLLIVMFLLTLGVITVFAFWFANRILQPLKKIIQDMHSINAFNLQNRLAVKGKRDLLFQLSMSFNQMLERLQTAFENQKRFIHNASHEFRTPLTVILGETDFALSQPQIKEDTKKSLIKVQNQADKLKNVTQSLLELAHLEEVKLKQSFKQFRFDELLSERLELFFTTYPQLKVEVNYPQKEAISSTYLEAYGNPIWMEMVFDNIIDNALKFSDFKTIHIQFLDTPNYVEVDIKDQGIGINKAELKEITQAFFRGENAEVATGSGLGLSLVKLLLEKQNGHFKVFSQKNKGTTVKLQLPKAP